MTVNKKNTERGFTLIEIMVVIIILGILASYVAIKLTGQTGEARITQAKDQIATFKNALEMYKMQNGSYPSTDQGLEALVSPPTAGKLPRNWKQNMERIPKDPWGNEYFYQSPGLHGDIDIWSYGGDREEGGEGEDADVNSWEVE